MDYQTFTEEIHALMLRRGMEYFNAGAVHQLMKTPDGWTAEVAGQETYRVVITGKRDITEWYCNCPHEHGPVCKHVAAVLYAIRDLRGRHEEE